jgi:hypothetical protein
VNKLKHRSSAKIRAPGDFPGAAWPPLRPPWGKAGARGPHEKSGGTVIIRSLVDPRPQRGPRGEEPRRRAGPPGGAGGGRGGLPQGKVGGMLIIRSLIDPRLIPLLDTLFVKPQSRHDFSRPLFRLLAERIQFFRRQLAQNIDVRLGVFCLQRASVDHSQ